jgi:hypothetical protein
VRGISGTVIISNIKLEFAVLKAVAMETSIFLDKTPCNLMKVNRRFGGTYLLNLQGERLKQ